MPDPNNAEWHVWQPRAEQTSPNFQVRKTITQREQPVCTCAADRDHYVRLFNRLEAAISHHKKAHDSGQFFTDTPDEALWAARDKILKTAASKDQRQSQENE
jgi:hypothetical protein